MADSRVLVVDDEDLILHVLKEFFRMRGDHCDVAGNGVEALRLVDDRIYDLVLSDISMPGMDGLELVRRIKSLQPQTVCLLMSGLGTRRDVLSALKIGVFDFIDKPIPDLAGLTMVVDRAMENSRVVRERDALLENLRHQNAKLEYSLVRLHEAFTQLRQQEEALESDLKKAQHVQRKFLPAGFPPVPSLDFFGYYAPADQVGGDFFGTLSLADGSTAIYLVDVAGHGVSAAMITVTFREIMRAERRMAQGDALFSDPGAVLRFMNRALIEEAFDPPIFVSMVYAVFSKEGRVTVGSAGHPQPLLLTGGTEPQPIACLGSVLGTTQPGDYICAEVQLQPHDLLLFYSDGLTEVRNTGGQELSVERVRTLLASNAPATARVVGTRLEEHMLQHLGGLAPTDDVTFILARHDPALVYPQGGTADDLVPDSVKIVMPDRLRHVRTDVRGRVQGGWHEKQCVIVLGGIVTWQVAPAIREIIRQGRQRAVPPIHVDLSSCESMDSTALGLLLQHAAEMVLHQPGTRVVGQLHEMGVLHHFTISNERSMSVDVPIPVAPNDTQEACSELILSAHQALMEASASNRQKFKDVVDALKQEKT